MASHSGSKVETYIALQFLAFLCVLDGEIISHLGEPDAVCLLTVFGLREKSSQINGVLERKLQQTKI